jgi:hypothetical protein
LSECKKCSSAAVAACGCTNPRDEFAFDAQNLGDAPADREPFGSFTVAAEAVLVDIARRLAE